MPDTLSVGSVHHLRLTVTDVERSRAFYTDVLGFEVVADAPPPPDDPAHDVVVELLQGGIVLANAGTLIGLRPVDESRLADADRFDPLRVGLDHLSFAVASRADLEEAARRLDRRNVAHSEICDLASFGISVLPFRDRTASSSS